MYTYLLQPILSAAFILYSILLKYILYNNYNYYNYS